MGCLIHSRIFSFHITRKKLSATPHFSKSEFNHVIKARICFLCSPSFLFWQSYWFDTRTRWFGMVWMDLPTLNHANLYLIASCAKMTTSVDKKKCQECLLCASGRLSTLGPWELGRSQQRTLASKMSIVTQGCVSRSTAKSLGQGCLCPALTARHIWMPVAGLMPPSTGKTPITWIELMPTTLRTWGCPLSTVLEPEAVGLIQPGAKTTSGGCQSHPSA